MIRVAGCQYRRLPLPLVVECILKDSKRDEPYRVCVDRALLDTCCPGQNVRNGPVRTSPACRASVRIHLSLPKKLSKCRCGDDRFLCIYPGASRHFAGHARLCPRSIPSVRSLIRASEFPPFDTVSSENGAPRTPVSRMNPRSGRDGTRRIAPRGGFYHIVAGGAIAFGSAEQRVARGRRR
jgi:hypothetical protein